MDIEALGEIVFGGLEWLFWLLIICLIFLPFGIFEVAKLVISVIHYYA